MKPRNKIGPSSDSSSTTAASMGVPQSPSPATLAQQALWYLDRLEPGDPAWNIAVRFRLRGPLNIPTFERAINEVVRRHEVLRTTFSFLDHAPVQYVHQTAAIPLPVDDLSRLPLPD